MAKEIGKEERMWGAFCHLGGLGLFVAPLILWMIKREESDYVDRAGKQAIDFQITASFLIIPLVLLSFVSWFFLILLIPALMYDLVMIAIASVKAHEGEEFAYPLSLRFIRGKAAAAAAKPAPAAKKEPEAPKAEEKPAEKAPAKKKAASKKKSAKKKASKKKSRR